MYPILNKVLDLVFSILILLVLSPVFAIIYLCSKKFIGGKVIFLQKRAGLNEEIFTIYKFKTMTDMKDKSGKLLPDEKRLSSYGKFLRATSLDEIPQLINILKGDMSFVGPRALLVEYLPRYSTEQHKRHSVKPGITGWAQVNGRNAISWEKKFEYDLWYVENHSLKLDIKILFLTLVKVLKKDGISSIDHATMPEFLGDSRAHDVQDTGD